MLVHAKSFGFGAVSGIVGVSSVYPIDLVKTRLQNQKTGTRSAFLTASRIMSTEGVRGFYKGLPPQVLGIGPEKAIVMGVREYVMGTLGDRTKLKNHFYAGIVAGTIQCSVSNPVEVVKVRAQVSTGSVQIMPIIRSLGVSGLYRGYSACFCRDVCFAGIYFPVYELLRNRISAALGTAQGEKPSFLSALLAGTLAGVPAAAVSCPFDVIKTRMQASEAGGAANQSFRSVLGELTAAGPSSLFAGVGPRCARLAPQFGVVLLTYELLQGWF